uniref:Lipopolysaccharide export system permease protein n=1 Tax=Candidatus Kentrum sp. TUN TaxID=2126343 RepID=A0A451A4C3_9GAMM|nr:MAG: lipopolysaccharide export system permease protein [Candidatus Kentron sp. TUN]VFK60871.1 MAG: lipopolysaccharide export system permease protein [Candidatus Kentron sp. TUN]VFK67063.1 MAG: lipopolysaccharide export system permease protein [Candidatus Kentron sp. TUN]
MKRLDRYIGTYVVLASLFTLAVLVALFSVIDFVDDLDNIGRNQYTLLRAVEHMLLSMPRLAFSTIPIAALIGTLMALGTLAGSAELTVMRASGVSLARLSLSVMKVGSILMVLTLVLGELVVPITERLAEERRSSALSDQISKTTYGFWIRDKRSFINIREVFPNNQVGDIYIYEFDDTRRLRFSTYAKSGYHEDGKWVLKDVQQSELTPDGITQRNVPEAKWESLFVPDVVDAVKVKPEGLSIIDLYQHIQYLQSNGLNSMAYEFAIWGKLIYPIATGVMIFVAIPMVLGWLRSVGIGQRIVAGVLLGITFHIVQQATMQMGLVFEMSPFLSVSVPVVMFLGFGLWMMRRVH